VAVRSIVAGKVGIPVSKGEGIDIGPILVAVGVGLVVMIGACNGGSLVCGPVPRSLMTAVPGSPRLSIMALAVRAVMAFP
jgi:hypothetical protein